LDFSSLQRFTHLLGKLFRADIDAHRPGTARITQNLADTAPLLQRMTQRRDALLGTQPAPS
jgi:hypothetical protein